MRSGRRAVSRRTLLLAGGGTAVAAVAGVFVGVETGVLPGRPSVDRALGLGEVDIPVPTGGAGPVTYRSFRSARCGVDVTWGVGLPPGRAVDGLPVVLVLHGQGSDAHAGFAALHLQAFLAAHARRGGRPFALVSVDGGNRYWHPRADGDDPLGMITDELLPRAGELGLQVGRIGVTGWSMGGYGSLMLARESEHGRLGELVVAAAAAMSPALFESYAASSPGSFDDAGDWQRWGSRHDDGYWRSLVPGNLAFLGEHLP